MDTSVPSLGSSYQKEIRQNRSRYSLGKTSGILNINLVSISTTVKDEEKEEVDPFIPTGSETMEEPKNLKPGESKFSDVIDSTDDCLTYTNDHRIVSTPEKTTATRGPDSPVCLGYGSVDIGTPYSSASPVSDANPSSLKKLLEFPQVHIAGASAMSQDNVMSSR